MVYSKSRTHTHCISHLSTYENRNQNFQFKPVLSTVFYVFLLDSTIPSHHPRVCMQLLYRLPACRGRVTHPGGQQPLGRLHQTDGHNFSCCPNIDKWMTFGHTYFVCWMYTYVCVYRSMGVYIHIDIRMICSIYVWFAISVGPTLTSCLICMHRASRTPHHWCKGTRWRPSI